jgi:hypothetical protein
LIHSTSATLKELWKKYSRSLISNSISLHQLTAVKTGRWWLMREFKMFGCGCTVHGTHPPT